MPRLVHWAPPGSSRRADPGTEFPLDFSVGGDSGAENGDPAKREPYLERVAKYIPAEIVAMYMAITVLVSGVPNEDPLKRYALWFVYGMCALLTVLYLHMTSPSSATLYGWPRWLQIGLATGAFMVWGYALGGPFRIGPDLAVGWHYREWFGGILVILYTFFAGLYIPSKPQTQPAKPDPNSGPPVGPSNSL